MVEPEGRMSCSQGFEIQHLMTATTQTTVRIDGLYVGDVAFIYNTRTSLVLTTSFATYVGLSKLGAPIPDALRAHHKPMTWLKLSQGSCMDSSALARGPVIPHSSSSIALLCISWHSSKYRRNSQSSSPRTVRLRCQCQRSPLRHQPSQVEIGVVGILTATVASDIASRDEALSNSHGVSNLAEHRSCSTTELFVQSTETPRQFSQWRSTCSFRLLSPTTLAEPLLLPRHADPELLFQSAHT